MPNYVRWREDGASCFFTVVTYNRSAILTSPISRKLLKVSWIEVMKKYPFRVDAICLLPDHIHCIITLPETDSDYSTRWRAMKGNFSRLYRQSNDIEDIPQSISRKQRRELPVWQRRFWEHMIRNDDDFSRHVEYIHFNPVKHKLVSNPYDWPWSSFHRYVRKGIYPKDWITDDEDFKGLVSAGE